MSRAKVKQHIADGQLEEALLAANKLRDLSDQERHQLLLLNGRFNKVRADVTKGIRSYAEADTEYSKIADALLSLVANRTGNLPTAPPNPPVSSYRVWLFVAMAVVLGVVAYAVWPTKSEDPVTPPVVKQTHTATQLPASAKDRLANLSVRKEIKLPELRMLLFESGSQTVSYALTDAALLIPAQGDTKKLYCSWRVINNHDFPINFWDQAFRFQPTDSPPLAPESGLNELIAGRSFKDGKVIFELPKHVQSGQIIVKHGGVERSLVLSFH
jgi:hypothetical protein